MIIQKKYFILVVLICITCFGSCSLFILDFGNPVDPKSDVYNGFRTVSSVDEVTGDWPAADSSAIWCKFNTSIVIDNGAELYGIQIFNGTEEADSPFYENMTSTGNLFYCDLLEDVYSYRVKAKPVGGDWPENWSPLVTYEGKSGIETISPGYDEIIEDTTPLIDWNSITNAISYEIEFSSDQTALDMSDIRNVSVSEYQIPEDEHFNYDEICYWRVRGIDNEGIATYWTNVNSFSFGWEIEWANIAPVDNGSITAVAPYLDWDDVTGAASYEVEFSKSSAALNGTDIRQTIGSGYGVPVGESYEIGDTCWWHVRAIDESGAHSDWSDKYSCWISPAIGDIWAGGIVFHLDFVGGGLVAAESNQSTASVWASYNTDIGGDNDEAAPELSGIGSGAENTAAIVLAIGDNGGVPYAAKICSDLVLNGYDDWYLPSIRELEKMDKNLSGFIDTYYWSSTESSYSYAWVQDMNSYYSSNYGDYTISKISEYPVRAIRSFYH